MQYYDVRKAKEIKVGFCHNGNINDIQFQPYECTFATCSDDKTVFLFNKIIGKILGLFKFVSDITTYGGKNCE